MFSPNLRQPIWCNWESLTEYNKGRIPSLYKLSSFDMFTMENLQFKFENTSKRMPKIMALTNVRLRNL